MENAWFESMKTRDPRSLVCNREIRVPQCESLQKKGFWGSPQGEHCGENTHKQMSLLWRWKINIFRGGLGFSTLSPTVRNETLHHKMTLRKDARQPRRCHMIRMDCGTYTVNIVDNMMHIVSNVSMTYCPEKEQGHLQVEKVTQLIYVT